MERKQFTFYRSFWEACKALPKKDQLPFLRAVCAYAFEEELPPVSGAPAAAFALVQPVLDSSRRKAESGSSGGSKPKANRRQTESRPEANASEGENEGENENERKKEDEKKNEKKKENESSPPFIPPAGGKGFGAELMAALTDWMRYKAERGQKYKPTGLMALVEETGRYAGECGEAAVAAVIRKSMANGWAGIAWETIERPAPEKQADREDLSWMKQYL